jgi:hypothetical protein
MAEEKASRETLKIDGLAKFFQKASEPNTMILLYNSVTREASCARCNASSIGDYVIHHRDCCPCIGGKGCFGKP